VPGEEEEGEGEEEGEIKDKFGIYSNNVIATTRKQS
jgi:hypothetical protein